MKKNCCECHVSISNNFLIFNICRKSYGLHVSDFISLLIVEKYGKDYMIFSYIIEMWKGMILQIPVKILKHIFQVSTRQVLVPKAQSIVLKGQFYILEKL